MRPLHQLITNPQAWIWAYLVGANGRYIGGQRNRYAPIIHLYQIERGTPPTIDPMEPGNAYRRQFWQVWRANNMTREQAVNPLCGPINTRSRQPRSHVAPQYWSNDWRCDDCQRIAREQAIHHQTWNDLVLSDPWYRMQRENRTMEADPISGQ